MSTQEQQMFKALQNTIAALTRQLKDANRKNAELMELVTLQSQQVKALLQKIDKLTGGPKDNPLSEQGYFYVLHKHEVDRICRVKMGLLNSYRLKRKRYGRLK